MWKMLPESNDCYRIDENGAVETCKKKIGMKWIKSEEWTPLKRWQGHAGHWITSIHANGKTQFIRIHRYVLMLFGEPMPYSGALALHRDDNKDNNHISNLYWGTPKNNSDDSIKNGGQVRGSKSKHAIFTEQQVEDILKMMIEGKSNVEIACHFKCSNGAIDHIRKRESWNHVKINGIIPKNKRKFIGAKLTEFQVLEIRKLCDEGKTDIEIATQYKISNAAIWAIRNRMHWKHI